MKKIVNQNTNVQNLETLQLDDENIVALLANGVDVGILTRKEFENGDYYFLCLNEASWNGNFFTGDSFIAGDVKTCISSALKRGMQVFLFEDIKEFGNWLARKSK